MKHKLLLSLILMFAICVQTDAGTRHFIALRNIMPSNMNYYDNPVTKEHGHVIRRCPSAPMYVVLEDETLTFNFAREEDAEVTIFTLDGVRVGYYVVSPEENSVTLSSDTPTSFVIQVTIGDAVYEGAVE